MKIHRMAIRGVVALVVAPLAVAQPPATQAQASPEMYCVYRRVTDWDADKVVATVFLSDETPETDIGRAALIVDRAATACAAEHKLVDGRLAAVRDIGMYGVAMDLLSAQLAEQKATPAAVAGVYAVFNGMAQDDRHRMFQDNWRSDLRFNQALSDGLLANGLPDDELAIELAFQILELSAMTEENVRLFRLGATAGD